MPKDKQDVVHDVFNHRAHIIGLSSQFCKELWHNICRHDESKMGEPELSAFSEDGNIDDGLAHHYKNNRHHPEHFSNGVEEMNLFELIEMFFDWMALCDVHDKEDAITVITRMSAKYNLHPQLCKILVNTYLSMRNSSYSYFMIPKG